MKLSDLKTLIEELEMEFGDHDPEVVLGTQPNYPMEAGVRGLTVSDDEDTKRLVILEGGHRGYGSRSWWDNPLS